MGICRLIIVEFHDKLEVGIVPIFAELGVDDGFALVLIVVVDGGLEVLQAVGLVAQTSIADSAQVVDILVLVEAAVERADGSAGLVAHQLGEGQVVGARIGLEGLLLFQITSFSLTFLDFNMEFNLWLLISDVGLSSLV